MILVGKAGSGKDTFAAMFPKLRKFAFADNLKKVVSIAQIDGVPKAVDYIIANTGRYDSNMVPILQYAQDNSESGKNRNVLQKVGAGFRNIEPDFWIDWLKSDIVAAGSPPYIITDCRYENEFNAFADDISVYIFASKKTRIRRLFQRDGKYNAKLSRHPSEYGLDKFCDRCTYKVDNSRDSLVDLRIKAEAIKRREEDIH